MPANAATIEERLAELGLVLPAEHEKMRDVNFPFNWAHVRGDRVFLSGHVPLNPDGSLAGPFGLVGGEVSLEQAQEAARLATLAMLASLQRAIGSLEGVTAWLRVFGMVAAAPAFDQHPIVINGCSNLLIEVFGPERGAHARSVMGASSLPFNNCVELEAEVEIAAS